MMRLKRFYTTLKASRPWRVVSEFAIVVGIACGALLGIVLIGVITGSTLVSRGVRGWYEEHFKAR